MPPDQPWLLRSLALSQMSRGAADQAEAALRRAVAIDAADAEAHDTLWRVGRAVRATNRGGDAPSHRTCAKRNSSHRTLSNLAIALQVQGGHVEAEQCCRDALLAQPDYRTSRTAICCSLSTTTNDLTEAAIFAEIR